MKDVSDLAVLHAILRRDFPSFVRKVFCTLNPTVAYLDNWHVHAICWHLEQVRLGKIKRLIITLPPRSMKSTICSIAGPAFMLGHDPSCSIVCVSYGQDLAAKLQNDFRLVLASPWYKSVFPGTVVSALKDAEGEILLTKRGGRIATSVGGALTGRGADIFFIDDPLKPIDAHSEAKRSAVNDWFQSTAYSRLNQKLTGAIVIVTQRLHVDDLVGSILDRDPDGWTHLSLPAIASCNSVIQIGDGLFHHRAVGSVLHEEREPRHVLDQIWRDIGATAAEAQYNQAPMPPSGNLIRRKWIQRYDRPPSRSAGDRVFQSWDTASHTAEHNDFSACVTMHYKDGLYYLVHVFREKLSYTELRTKAIALAQEFAVDAVLVEDTGVGPGLISDLRRFSISAIGMRPEQDKFSRAAVHTPKFESGLVKLPQGAPWLSEFESELFSFPSSRHDDQVDALTQALSYDVRPEVTFRTIKF